jgi:hypothetical protein
MGFELANPAFAWGMLLAALPLIIHLINRRRARPQQFAAIDFILRSRRRTARRLRLRRLLLFAVRTLMLLALPLAFARPQRAKGPAEKVVEGPAATALVLDTSLSMSYQQDGHPLLDRAREMARKALADLEPESSVTFLTCAPQTEPPKAPGFDRAEVRRAIDAAEQTWAPQDLNACLERAARALGESPIPAKRIVLATDLTASSLRLELPAPVVQSQAGEVHPEVVLLDAAGGVEELPNAAITDLRVEPAPAIARRAYQVSVTIANYSSRPLSDLQATLRIGGEVVAKGFLDVPARGTAVKNLSYRFPAGGTFSGAVEIAADGLAADDTRYFTLRVPRDARALIVDGAPSSVRYLDEAFFVQTALDAASSPVSAKLRDADSLGSESLSAYDLVLLLNVRELSEAKVRDLGELVERGGGLFISLGDQVDPDHFNATFGSLLPRPLHLVKTAAEPHQADSERRAARLDQIHFEHPALSVFSGEAREGLLAARTYRYFLLSPTGAGEASVLASFDDGAPALVEARHGKGRVILYTSTVDRNWSDWPIRTSFLPLVQRLSGWLAGTLDETSVEQVLVGEPRTVAAPEGTSSLSFETPDGRTLKPESAEAGGSRITDTSVPGTYRASGKLSGAVAKVPEVDFSVNVDPRESALWRVDARELKAYFGEKTLTTKVAGKDEAQPELPIWSLLLALVAGLFFIEGILARK